MEGGSYFSVSQKLLWMRDLTVFANVVYSLDIKRSCGFSNGDSFFTHLVFLKLIISMKLNFSAK